MNAHWKRKCNQLFGLYWLQETFRFCIELVRFPEKTNMVHHARNAVANIWGKTNWKKEWKGGNMGISEKA